MFACTVRGLLVKPPVFSAKKRLASSLKTTLFHVFFLLKSIFFLISFFFSLVCPLNDPFVLKGSFSFFLLCALWSVPEKHGFSCAALLFLVFSLRLGEYSKRNSPLDYSFLADFCFSINVPGLCKLWFSTVIPSFGGFTFFLQKTLSAQKA